MTKKEISKSVLKRLPGDLAYLKTIPEDASPYISATSLASALGMGEVQVRKDLAMVSDGGRPKVGYLRAGLIDDIEQFLGYDNTTDAVLIGAGKLGQALCGYSGFEAYGLNILAAFDAKPSAELTDEGKPIYPMEQLESFCKANKVLMGIITVPAAHAQGVCDQLIGCGDKFALRDREISLGGTVTDDGVMLLVQNLQLLALFLVGGVNLFVGLQHGHGCGVS